ncbi:MAG: hypothetical protein HDS72_04525 [Bacteroidales bacterium]|nr:hypothetical protein [Bacteroidales bacterium]
MKTENTQSSVNTPYTVLVPYTGTKTVFAMPMAKPDAEKELGRTINAATPGTEGYLVEYPDGYRSWSPKAVFEEAYKPSATHVDRMKIELADLKHRILKATAAVYAPDLLSFDERDDLKCQLKAMHEYARILFDRIRHATEPRTTIAPVEFEQV